jgi:cysteine desulfurase / selenocysteine lyase
VNPSPYRKLFPLSEDYVFLDHAGVAPVSTRVADAVRRFLDEATVDGPRRYPYWNLRAEEIRAACGRLVGAEARQVAFVKNTSEALSFVARGLAWQRGDVVLVADREFPSNVYPWWALADLGVETRFIEVGEGGVDAEAVARSFDDRVRLVALSAVAYGTGERPDLGAIGRLCRARGAFFVVDGAQAIGALPLHLERQRLDCIAADGHKWLCAPEGAGFMALSERLLDRVQPIELGWKSVVNGEASFYPYDLTLRRDAAKLEAGSLNLMAIHGLGAAVDLALEVGLEEIESRVRALVTLLGDGLSERGRSMSGEASLDPKRSAGIVTFVPRGNPERIRQELWSRGVVVRTRFGGLRLAPHHYQDDGDVARFFERYDAAEASI